MTDEATVSDKSEMLFTLHVIFKSGERQSIRDNLTEEGVSAALESFGHIQDHLKKFGFSGWRLIGGFMFLNMSEVASIYVTPQNDSEDDDAGEEDVE